MRILYTMIRVADLDRSVAFYTGPMGMTLFRREDYPAGRFTLAFVGYGESEEAGALIELTWNWDAQGYDKGNGWGHVAIGVLIAQRSTMLSPRGLGPEMPFA